MTRIPEMSVVTRLLNRSFKRALHGTLQDGALQTELHGRQLFRSSCTRFFSQPKPAAEANKESQPEPQSPGSAPAQKPAPGAPQKPQTPQPAAAQKPGAGTNPVKAPTPGAPQPKPGVSRVLPPGQKPQPALKPGVVVRAPVAGAGSGQKLQAHASPGSGGSSAPKAGASGGQSKLKMFLASGVVVSLVLGLLYWQSPTLHDGPPAFGGKGKGDGSGTKTPHQVASENPVHVPVEEPEAKPEPEPEPEPEVQSEQTEETIVKIYLEPEGVKVEASPVGSGSVEVENKENGSSSEKRMENEIHREEFIAKIEPEPGSSLEKVVIEFEPPGDESIDTVVQVTEERNEPKELSKSFLVQKGHEDAVKEHDQGSDENDKLKAGLDLVAAIHAAEHRQAEIDAIFFNEQLRRLEEKHQHEVSDVEQRAASFHEEVRRLQEDMERERQRHAENLKLQKEQAEFALQENLKLMEEARERQREEAELLAKAEAASALIQERVNFLNEIGSIKVHMEAMNIALAAKSEEVREGHEIRQLSLGSFAFEHALQSGAAVDKEAALILKSTGGDPLVEVAVKSLPKEVLDEGTWTPAELDRRLEEMETTLRELALIPSSGGGLLCHLIARVATLVKLPDHGAHDDSGVDAVITQVQESVREGQLLDAAEKITRGLSGTNAEKLAEEWASQARNRAILEQASALLRAHAAALALRDDSSC